MKSKMKGVLGIALTLVLLVSLFAFAIPAAADPDVNEWSKFKYPTEGVKGGWLYDDTIVVVGPIAMAIDGTLYAYVEGAGSPATTNALFKSDDGGRSWSVSTHPRKYKGGPVVDIVCSSEDADIVYVADADDVYWSENAGTSFAAIAPDSLDTAFGVGSPGSNHVITSLDVSYIGGDPFVFISTKADSYGGTVFFINQEDYLAGWIDMDMQAYGAYDVYAINAAPDFADSHKIFAVITLATETRIVTNTGTEGAWSKWGASLLDGSATPAAMQIDGASNVCFPDDFDNDELLVGVGALTVKGSVYRVTESPDAAYRLHRGPGPTSDIDVDIISLQLMGDIGATVLLAGAQDIADVFYSTDDGEKWDDASKRPSGGGPTFVLMAEDFADSDEAWAATAGTEGAISYTIDGGKLFNQISLIGTDMDDTILDVSFYPDYESSGKLFLLTTDGDDSLWRYDGEYWERVAEEGVLGGTIDLVQVSPDIGSTDTLYIAETSGPTLRRSTNEGQSWSKLRCQPDSGGHYSTFGGWIVIDDDTVIVGGDDSGVGYTYKTTGHGNRVWDDEKVDAKAGSIVSFARSGDELLCGDDGNGTESTSRVFISEDLGEDWDMVGKAGPAGGELESGASGDTYVAFDTGYDSNSYIYAAAVDEIDRFKVGDSDDWVIIGKDKVTTASGIATVDGCLYVSDSKAGAGMWRSVGPTGPAKPTLLVVFEAVDTASPFDLDSTATLKALQTTSGSNVLWALDGANPEVLWTYEDALVGPVVLDSPADGKSVGRMTEVTLTWKELSKAAKDYELKVYSDKGFKAAYKIYSGGIGSKEEVYRLSDLPSGTEFWWKVRVLKGNPLASKWSSARSFSTALGAAQWNPFEGPVNEYPWMGASDVPLAPSFAWNAADWATGYDFVLATGASFAPATRLVEKTVIATVYLYETELDYSTTYYWKVRAVSKTSTSEWATGVFTTMAKPVVPPAPTPPVEIPPLPAPITPAWIWAIVIIGAVLVIAVIVLIVLTRRVP